MNGALPHAPKQRSYSPFANCSDQVLSEKMKYNNNRTVFEIEMIHLCKPQMDTDYSGLYHRIQQLENIVEQLLAGNTNIPTQKLCINESEFTTFIIRPQNKIYTEMYYS